MEKENDEVEKENNEVETWWRKKIMRQGGEGE